VLESALIRQLGNWQDPIVCLLSGEMLLPVCAKVTADQVAVPVQYIELEHPSEGYLFCCTAKSLTVASMFGKALEATYIVDTFDATWALAQAHNLPGICLWDGESDHEYEVPQTTG
jgi:hypothetical protein